MSYPSRPDTVTSQAYSNRTTTAATTATQGSRIPTVNIDRPRQPYAGNPEDGGIPAFTRRESFYQTRTPQEEYRYLQAADVRRQVQQAPPTLYSTRGRYPVEHYNEPPKPLSAQQPWWEYPIVPSPQNGSAPGNYGSSSRPGPVRAFYNNGDRSRFDVGYHDLNEAPLGPRRDKAFPNTPYTLGQYHPAPTYSQVRRS
ncbi:uncharacterized protein F4822DRAFT_427992 [Hypoxylon trugodes]|uniref:uncharacterized protein n=1 Tax=Hypoxylon trugodes TaxID=326681 RepID=UPI002199EC0B|nr:uncharacterized protein F4822DRAFT_427992 [Hypoxylon trugodes]KAI1389651.1 hypothetical protein F4822DRAFT_427992 [Hypoxylon trugodes]